MAQVACTAAVAEAGTLAVRGLLAELSVAPLPTKVDSSTGLPPQRYLDSYWRMFAAEGWFLAGDGARYDDDGDTWILGRVDDVINVSGHRLSTIEIESALVSHPVVAEAAVVGAADEATGQAVVTLRFWEIAG